MVMMMSKRQELERMILEVFKGKMIFNNEINKWVCCFLMNAEENYIYTRLKQELKQTEVE